MSSGESCRPVLRTKQHANLKKAFEDMTHVTDTNCVECQFTADIQTCISVSRPGVCIYWTRAKSKKAVVALAKLPGSEGNTTADSNAHSKAVVY